jgi:hypothetical protein
MMTIPFPSEKCLPLVAGKLLIDDEFIPHWQRFLSDWSKVFFPSNRLPNPATRAEFDHASTTVEN